jgi:hypothetical protein
MKRFSALLIAFLMIAASASAQVGTIKGIVKIKKVVNGKDTIVPLIGAQVFVKYGDQITADHTDIRGSYTLKPLPPATYTVTVLDATIDTLKIVNVNVSGTDITFVPEQLVSNVRVLKVVKIVDPGEPIVKGIPSKEDMKREQLKDLPNLDNINSILSSMSSLVFQSERTNEVSFRGARMGDALYIVDGVPQRGTQVDIPNLSINKVTAIYGGVPAKYGDFMGGVVEIETRTYFDWLNEQAIKELVYKEEYAKTKESKKETENKKKK